ncbi:response regulator [Tolypothrix bouteillei VB521301_2]|uniref:response regulator n=1 Tax=Tolypothrix bouteillei TaxID=1246981 RepID=UPI0005140C96
MMNYLEVPKKIFLLVEDNSDDIAYILRAIHKSELNIFIQWVETGEEAIDYLLGIGKYVNRKAYPLPSAIISDNNLSGITGIELLECIRKQQNLKNIPFTLMSHSILDIDINQVTYLGATYYAKGISIDEYIKILSILNDATGF